jgi:hypothetical protein
MSGAMKLGVILTMDMLKVLRIQLQFRLLMAKTSVRRTLRFELT